MSERMCRRWTLVWGVPAACVLLVASVYSGAQENPPPAATPATAAIQPEAAAPAQPVEAAAKKTFRNRLPMYFSPVVTTEQRKKIYEIQASYFEKISAMEAQLAALRKQQDADVLAVLTPEQQGEVQKAREAASARRRGTASGETSGGSQN